MGKEQFLASHNSWSYLPERKKWMRLLRPFSRCQESSVITQYFLGVRVFDLRLKVRPDGIVIAHGLVEYQTNWVYIDKQLKALASMSNENDRVKVRVLIENYGRIDDVMGDDFYDMCSGLQLQYPDIEFFGGFGAHARYWRKNFFKFDGNEPELYDRYSSVSAKFPLRLFPKAYAIMHNEENKEKVWPEEGYLFLDFVDL